MRRLKRLIAAIILASTIFLTVSFGKVAEAPEEPPEEVETIPPVAYDDSAEAIELAELKQRKHAHRSEVERIARAKAAEALAEAERQRHIALESERKRAQLAKAVASKPAKATPVQPSRSQAYVGKAQSYEATFYTAWCPSGCTGVTASGYDVSSTIYYDGMRILAAPKHIPLYSIMRVTMADGATFDGIVLDRGGDIGAGRIDILVKTRQEAYVHGRQTVEVRMIRKGR